MQRPALVDFFTYFGYMSGQIYKRSLWKKAVNSTPNIERFFNCYTTLFTATKIVLNHPNWLYLHEAFVCYRSDNDSFLKELGPYKRFLLDAVGYEDIANALLNRGSRLYRLCLKKACQQHLVQRSAISV